MPNGQYMNVNTLEDHGDAAMLPQNVQSSQSSDHPGILSKVASSLAKGCWMGGVPPYGYDLRYENPTVYFINHTG